MLSAAAAALSAAAFFPASLSAALADTTISNATSTILATSSSGNISIDTGGSINTKAAAPLVTLNSNNFVLNQGNLINDGYTKIETDIRVLLLPGAFLATVLFCLNYITDGLRDAFDPNER